MGRRGAGTRRERRARGGEWSGGRNQGGSNRDTGVGIAGERNRSDHAVLKEWGEKVDPAFGHWAEGDIHDRVVESDEILKVNGSDRNQERLREVAVAVVSITHGEVKSSTVHGGRQREQLREWELVQEGAG